jgi:hypothetical protein
MIPANTAVPYKMSRKVDTDLLVLRSDDNGATWTSGGDFPTYNGRIQMLFYTTKANPTELAVNTEVLSLGDVSALGNHTAGRGSVLVSNLIGKIPTTNLVDAVATVPLLTGGINPETKKLGYDATFGLPTHTTIDLAGTISPAAKVWTQLTRENGRAHINLLYKEMVFDATQNEVLDATQVTGAVAQNSVAVDDYFHLISTGAASVANGVYRQVQLWSGSTFDSRFTSGDFMVSTEGDMIAGAGVIIAKRWNGNGWGDDNKFTVLDNETTETDDNGNTIIVGQKRIELLNFIGDAE